MQTNGDKHGDVHAHVTLVQCHLPAWNLQAWILPYMGESIVACHTPEPQHGIDTL